MFLLEFAYSIKLFFSSPFSATFHNQLEIPQDPSALPHAFIASKLRDETNICLFPYLICSYQKENFQISFIIKMKLSNKYCCISCDKISNIILNINLHFSLFLPFALYFISFGSAPTHDRVGVPREPSAAPQALIQNGE